MQPQGNPNKKTVTSAASSNDFANAATLWNVMVRHSPFLLKNVEVEAASPDEAKEKFLLLAKAKHESRAARVPEQRGLDGQTVAQAQRSIRQAYERGIEAKDRLEWSIRPAADVKKEREDISARQGRVLAGV